jgi:hypothetical protein
MTMLSLRFLLSFILLAQTSAFLPSLEEKEIEVIPNPHVVDEQMTCSSSLQYLLQPHYLLIKPKVTQEDTFQEITFAKVLTVPVPIYRMKQPPRLSAMELGFSLVLVRDLSTHVNVYETPVERERALDSWFVGYMWTPIVYKCSDNVLHIGWKFTSVNGNEGDSFYALLVNINERQKTNMIQVGSFQAPGWMAALVMT